MKKDDIYDVIIVGSGPAGLSAAIYAQRAELKTLIIEKNYISGGQITQTYEVDNYPGYPGITGLDLAEKMRTHAEKLGASFLTEEITAVSEDGGIWLLQGKENQYRTRTILAACGAEHRKLKIPGEEEFMGSGQLLCHL